MSLRAAEVEFPVCYYQPAGDQARDIAKHTTMSSDEVSLLSVAISDFKRSDDMEHTIDIEGTKFTMKRRVA